MSMQYDAIHRNSKAGNAHGELAAVNDKEYVLLDLRGNGIAARNGGSVQVHCSAGRLGARMYVTNKPVEKDGPMPDAANNAGSFWKETREAEVTIQPNNSEFWTFHGGRNWTNENAILVPTMVLILRAEAANTEFSVWPFWPV